MSVRRVSLVMRDVLVFVAQMVAFVWVVVIAVVLFTVLFYALVVWPLLWLGTAADCLMFGSC